jgi:hypothetical protein
MENTRTTRLNWVEQELFEGVVKVIVAEGDTGCIIEVQEDTDGLVVGTLWRRIPATFWEPEDVECMVEEVYESVDAAVLALEKLDAEELRLQQEDERRMYEEYSRMAED